MGRRGAAWLALLLVLLAPLTARGESDLGSIQRERTQLSGHLQGIDREQQQVLADLFALNRQLEDLQRQIEDLDRQVAAAGERLAALEAEAARLQQRLQAVRAQFGRRVRFLYEHGAVAYLDVLLAATDFGDFLDRLAFLELAIRHDARLMAQVRELAREVAAQQGAVLAQRQALASLRARQEARRQDLAAAAAKREARLAVLREQRGQVEAALARLEALWHDAARPLLAAFGRAFHTVALRAGDLDLEPGSVAVSGFPPRATVVLSEQALNRFLTRFPDLAGLRFALHSGQADLVGDFAGVPLAIEGEFQVVGDAVLRYAPRAIRFFGVPIPDAMAAALVQGGHLDVDVAQVVPQVRVRLLEARVEEGRLVVRAALGQ